MDSSVLDSDMTSVAIPPEPPSARMTSADHRWRLIRRCVRSLLLTALVGSVIAGLVALTLLPRRYQSSATLIFPSPAGSSSAAMGAAALIQARFGLPEGSVLSLTGYEALLNSERALLDVAQQLDVARLYELDRRSEVLQFMREALKSSLNNADQTITITGTAIGSAQVTRMSDLWDRPAAANRDRWARQLAAQLVVALIRSMTRMADEIQLDRTKERYRSLQEQVDEATDQLLAMNADYAELEATLDATDLEHYGQVLIDDLARLEQQVALTQSSLAAVDSELSLARQQVTASLDNVAALPEEFGLLAAARSASREAKQAFELANEQYGPQSPQVQGARLALDGAETELHRQMAAAKQGFLDRVQELEARQAALESQQATLQQAVVERQAELRRLPGIGQAIAGPKLALTQQEGKVTALQNELLLAEFDYLKRGVRWHVLDVPVAPDRKRSPRVLFSVVLGALLGLVLLGWQPLWTLYTTLQPTAATDSQPDAVAPPAAPPTEPSSSTPPWGTPSQ